ncbi:DUF3304 domain-containing protein [Burkholderia multivorans]|uniref:DUF3304 domain-containing protein n=1 Tax=Burkholderia multivorans TaxID=87883 RepID=UPI0009BA32C3|nr:DUF3304 domain-containing protein [Burkholderia multivorans]MBU9245198.1 DUF3304 domain-containing protein [Burkholderia multivorans]MCO7336620.1 DUF3304 domain-containing protein [Burkholderia multivorans]MCO7338748.1 DUF3304 domain-containing protein [Burkholderia multivorans]MCO7346543.1 DUF3304 domain-containing protein [Burkholderia multivorans]HDR9338367.1 DUF3304 domain-containing protein [Burkholderia multivorans]
MKTNRFIGVVVLLVLLAGCAGLHADESSTVEMPKRVELNSGDSRSMNYTPWYIHTFSISGPKGTRIGGGGGNMWPMEEDGYPGHSGGQCCTRYPREWQPDLRLTVRWKVDKKMDGKTPGYWYKADNVQIPQYDGSRSGGVWAIFLPGDRVKLMVADGNANGHNSVMVRPTDDDPYVIKGELDDEWNRLYRYRGSKK